jgi:hypothetical protein
MLPNNNPIKLLLGTLCYLHSQYFAFCAHVKVYNNGDSSVPVSDCIVPYVPTLRCTTTAIVAYLSVTVFWFFYADSSVPVSDPIVAYLSVTVFWFVYAVYCTCQ